MLTVFVGARFQGISKEGVTAFGKLYIRDANTGLPASNYKDFNGNIPNSYPISLDENGQADVYLDDGIYSIELVDSNGVTIWSVNYPVICCGSREIPPPDGDEAA